METDRESTPGFFPDRFEWQGRKTISGLAIAAVLGVALLSGSEAILGAAILALGIGCFVWALRQPSDGMREQLRLTRGPGWWIAWLMSKAPGSGAKVLFLLLSVGIAALGIGALIEAAH